MVYLLKKLNIRNAHSTTGLVFLYMVETKQLQLISVSKFSIIFLFITKYSKYPNRHVQAVGF